ncbi:hypothetical protein OS187_13145 [Xanthomonadaceae bacterium JHOS43]|nr:hypothetical protein [Xanthomonadaceae bacterium JHOS43]
MTDAPRRRPGRPPEARRAPSLPPRLEPGDEEGARAVLAAFAMVLMQFDDGRTRNNAGVRLVTGSENIATAWRTIHGPDAALPHNPGFAQCARRWLDEGQHGTALALIHFARRNGWEDDAFEGLERECLRGSSL